MSEENATEFQLTQEVRFAVVLYGGLSLAIYMNGVAQELLRLVRSTAPLSNDPGTEDDRRAKLAGAQVNDGREKLQGTEAVYRKLGQILARGEKPLCVSQLEEDTPGPIRTRFIVDVISGTSAGGINGVFLAKALANDQSIGQLKELWVREGDFARLMNDRGLTALAPHPQSLLDGRHMYTELLKALEGMESPDSDPGGTGDEPRTDSPYADEIDLFVTATDISGLTLPLQLADGVVEERRHRNTFHFVYSGRSAASERRNDFMHRYNPFLAFAARCTSAFPVAFEPMRLSDIDAVVPTLPYYRDKGRTQLKEYLSGSKTWRAFFQDYLTDGGGDGELPDFSLRAFADGGALDNKPFSYATDTLLRRRADLPVDRKLIYVDPDPQNPRKQPDFDRDVDLLENTLTALSPTVSTETIREDLQRILERNRLIERIRYVTYDVEADVQAWRGQRHEPPLPGEQWAAMKLQEMIKRRGIAYGGHHRLKIDAVTDELATIVVNAASLDKKSDHFVAVRDYVRAWRNLKFDDGQTGTGKLTQNQFLIDYDLSYRLRRLNFLRARLDELSSADFTADGEARRKLLEDLERAAINVAPPDADGWKSFQKNFRGVLRATQRRLNGVYENLLAVQRRFRLIGAANPVNEPVADIIRIINEVASANSDARRNGDGNWLKAFLKEPDSGRRLEQARAFIEGHRTVQERFERLADILINGKAAEGSSPAVKGFKQATREASDECTEILAPPQFNVAQTPDGSEPPRPSNEELAARGLLWHLYQGYEDYDMAIFPITYATDVGETVPVDVIRVSPFDAKNLIDETQDGGRRKLGGTALGHFGAFFDPAWRKNDIMWGRLDAAERIIKTLLPEGHPDRDALVDEAHRAILREEVLPEGEGSLRKVYVGSLIRAGARAGLTQTDALRDAVERLAAGPPHKPRLKEVLDALVGHDEADAPGGDRLLKYFKEGYEIDRRLDPQVTVQLLARSTRVFGRMLEGLAEKSGADRKRVAWVTRLTQVFWGFVEVAVPGSFANLLARHLLKLLYAFEVFLILGGTLLANPDMQELGLKALAITLAANAAIWLLGWYMQGRHRFLRFFVGAGGLLVGIPLVASALLGLDELFSYEWVKHYLPQETLFEKLSLFKGMSPPARALFAIQIATFIAFALGLLYAAARLLAATARRLTGHARDLLGRARQEYEKRFPPGAKDAKDATPK